MNSAGSGSYGSVADDAANSKGYMGHGEFALVKGSLAQHFPIYNDGDNNATPSGKARQLQYTLVPGEASWQPRPDRVVEY